MFTVIIILQYSHFDVIYQIRGRVFYQDFQTPSFFNRINWKPDKTLECLILASQTAQTKEENHQSLR